MNKEKKKIDTCLLCGEKKPLIHAHILPKAYKKFLWDNDRRMVRVSFDGQESQVQTLPFNKYLFCGTCDNSFADDERELIQFSNDLFSGCLAVEEQGGKRVSVGDLNFGQIVLVRGFDALKIKRALLFLLYKFHLDPGAGIIYLDKVRGDVLRKMLCSNTLDADEFGVNVAHYKESEVLSNNGHKRLGNGQTNRTKILKKV